MGRSRGEDARRIAKTTLERNFDATRVRKKCWIVLKKKLGVVRWKNRMPANDERWSSQTKHVWVRIEKADN